MDTVALCGGALDDRHLWMLDGVDIRTDWTELRALENRSQHCTVAQVEDIEKSLPFPLLGLDSDWYVIWHSDPSRCCSPAADLTTRMTMLGSNNAIGLMCGSILVTSATITQRWLLGSMRCAKARWDRCKITFYQLKQKRRKHHRTVRVYGPALTPYARVLAANEVSQSKKSELRALHAQLNPFALAREIEQQKKIISSHRLLAA